MKPGERSSATAATVSATKANAARRPCRRARSDVDMNQPCRRTEVRRVRKHELGVEPERTSEARGVASRAPNLDAKPHRPSADVTRGWTTRSTGALVRMFHEVPWLEIESNARGNSRCRRPHGTNRPEPRPARAPSRVSRGRHRREIGDAGRAEVAPRRALTARRSAGTASGRAARARPSTPDRRRRGRSRATAQPAPAEPSPSCACAERSPSARSPRR
jgi:hypothetical protein